MKSLKEILMPSKAFYEKITDKRPLLVLGILLVGTNDLLISVLIKGWNKVFLDKSSNNLAFNIGLLALAVLVIGAIDILFFAKPLTDLLFGRSLENSIAYKLTKQLHVLGKKEKAEGEEKSATSMKSPLSQENDALIQQLNIKKSKAMVRFMKVYAGTHLLILPINLAIYYVFKGLTVNSSPTLIMAYVALDIFTLLWFTAIITKGANTIFKLELFFKQISFLVIFAWSYIMGYALDYMIRYWVIALLR